MTSNNSAKKLLNICRKSKFTIVTAESCTGGLLSSLFIANAGASKVIESGYITYSNQAKYKILGISKNIIDNYGAVSKEVSMSMADKATSISGADIAISITGIAGPTGGTKNKPVGLVYHGLKLKSINKIFCEKKYYSGNRKEIQKQAANYAIEFTLNTLLASI